MTNAEKIGLLTHEQKSFFVWKYMLLDNKEKCKDCPLLGKCNNHCREELYAWLNELN